jgi:thymidine kinase
MFSGKTARLIDALEAARAAGRSVCAFKHPLDRRYDPCQLATHDGRRFPATIVATPTEVRERGAAVQVVGIDEAQFFGRELAHACETMRARGQHVVVAGIDHDAWGRPFPPLPRLKEIADAVLLLEVPCRVCARPARYSQRMVPVTNTDMVGGPGEYEPRCAECFQPLPPAAPEY